MRRLSSRGNEARVKALEHNFTVPAVPRPRHDVRCMSVCPGRLRSLHHPRKEDQRPGCNPLVHDHLKPSLGVLAPVSSYKKKRLLVSLRLLVPRNSARLGHRFRRNACQKCVTLRTKHLSYKFSTAFEFHVVWHLFAAARWTH